MKDIRPFDIYFDILKSVTSRVLFSPLQFHQFVLNKRLNGYKQIVGHSLGGGTAALLTYILREQKEFATTTCVTFAPGLFLLLVITNIKSVLH